MATSQFSSRVDADADALFATLTDPSRLPSWNTAIRRVVDAPTPLAKGAEWVVELHVMGRTWNSRSEVAELNTDSRTFRYRSRTDDGNPSYADWSWQVSAAAAQGGSDVTVTWDLHPVTFWRRVLFVHIRHWQLRREVTASVDQLAAAARKMLPHG